MGGGGPPGAKSPTSGSSNKGCRGAERTGVELGLLPAECSRRAGGALHPSPPTPLTPVSPTLPSTSSLTFALVTGERTADTFCWCWTAFTFTEWSRNEDKWVRLLKERKPPSDKHSSLNFMALMITGPLVKVICTKATRHARFEQNAGFIHITKLS